MKKLIFKLSNQGKVTYKPTAFPKQFTTHNRNMYNIFTNVRSHKCLQPLNFLINQKLQKSMDYYILSIFKQSTKQIAKETTIRNGDD